MQYREMEDIFVKKILIGIIVVLLLAGCSGGEQVQSKPQDQGYVFNYNGIPIVVNTDVEPVLKELGEPLDYFEAESCAFQGLDKTYYYSGFELTTYPKDNTDYISSVYFMDDSVSTAEGIYIGSSVDDVLEAYGEDYTGGENAYIYTKGDSSLIIITENDEVISITYQALVEGLN
jgi:hypothetical protein